MFRGYYLQVSLVVGALVGLAHRAAAQSAHHGLDPANLDTTCAPCQDFYRFANGGWLARTALPPEYPSYGSFIELVERNNATLRRVVERLAAAAPARPETADQKLGVFYASCMDSARVEQAGAAPLENELERLGKIASAADVARALARGHHHGWGPVFTFGGAPDFKNSSLVIAVAVQGGLGLPDRDYYVRDDSTARALRTAYLAYVSGTLGLLGDPAARADSEAQHVLRLETVLARASLTRVERRDPAANYHKLGLRAADSLTPHLSWAAFLREAGAPEADAINLGQPRFFQAVDSLVGAAPLADWRAYLRWHFARHFSPWLSRPFVDLAFQFQRAVSGVKEQQPRWKRCLQAANVMVGDALGEAYVRETFTPTARSRAQEMVSNLRAALDDRLHTLEWMGDSTRAQALAKLGRFGTKIGYPDKWRDYSRLVVERGDFAGNVARAQTFGAEWNFARIGKPLDRAEWRMTTPTVNASYSPSFNDITFPAGILQAPFFDPANDDAVNYGGMGAVIGHEMTHGFDDQGRQFDAEGNLRDWWTPGDAQRFKDRAARVVAQFDAYTVVDSATHVNGRLTQGENIADLGGLKVAYAAFERSLAGKPRPPAIDGFTPEQRFFLAWAQIWRDKATDQYLRNQVVVDPHAPARWRVMGPLANLKEFAQAFGCKAGDPLVRPDSLGATIW
ncbi:MAG TPA: M13 family metallopeptidase [Gemmatimonadales bacterium]|nr:M13 family metallopeptidase [Gemmatimonadales bacterium]